MPSDQCCTFYFQTVQSSQSFAQCNYQGAGNSSVNCTFNCTANSSANCNLRRKRMFGIEHSAIKHDEQDYKLGNSSAFRSW